MAEQKQVKEEKVDNLFIYNQCKEVPENAQREIKGGRLAGMTDINPMWRIQKLTEVFGVCGFGWYTHILEKKIVDSGVNDNEKIAVVDVELFVRVNGLWSYPIFGTGGASFVAKEKDGMYVSDECFKMAYTDAISVACKALGIGADIYWGKAETKYNSKKDNSRQVEYGKAIPIKYGIYKNRKLGELSEIELKELVANSTNDFLRKWAKVVLDDMLEQNGEIVAENENTEEECPF